MAVPTPSIRADALMLAQGMVDTRSQAKRLIQDGRVQATTGEIIVKPSLILPETTQLRWLGAEPYVSRAGDKLAAFLKAYPVVTQGKIALDLGASTGGFTDCLLRAGAAHVSCVDVGHGQLHPRIAADARVANHEGVNARELHAVALPYANYDIIVMDLSFISLSLVLPAAWPRLRPGGILIALVKPQFEAGKEAGSKGRGIIRDPHVHERVLREVKTFASVLPGARLLGECPSPIKGGDGNREFLLGWQRDTKDP